MLSSPKFTSREISSGEDEEDYGRWSYTTYSGKDKTRLTIITASYIQTQWRHRYIYCSFSTVRHYGRKKYRTYVY